MVPDPAPVNVEASFPFGARREQAEPAAIKAILDAIGTGPRIVETEWAHGGGHRPVETA